MFGDMKNLGAMMKQAQQMQSKMEEMQKRLADIEASGQAGAGMVTCTVSGKGELKKVKLDRSMIDADDLEMLEDLIVAAFNDAKVKAEVAMQDEMSKLTGGLNLPAGMKLPF